MRTWSVELAECMVLWARFEFDPIASRSLARRIATALLAVRLESEHWPRILEAADDDNMFAVQVVSMVRATVGP